MSQLPPNNTIALAALSQPDLLKIQELLQRAGFNPGVLDGLYGANTQRAWAEFKKSVHLHDPADIEKIGITSYGALVATGKNRRGKIHDFTSKEGTIKAIIWECTNQGLPLETQQAYVLATVKHETAGTFRPLEEYGRGRGRKYGQPDPRTGKTYYGRGFVQLTWRSNYEKYGKILGIDLVNNPGLACNPNVALFILVHGFKHGTFTGRKLEDYVRPGKTDFIGARRCINGTDQALLIAKYARGYLA